MRNLIILLSLFFCQTTFSQKFSGIISFEITMVETPSSYDGNIKKSTLFIRDSLVRSENDSYLGKQVLISNLNNGEKFLLLNFQGVNLAIDMSDQINKKNDSLSSDKDFFKQTRKKKKICGYKTRMINYQKEGKELEAWYTGKIDPIYNSGDLQNLPGFALSYTVLDPDGINKYSCKDIKDYSKTKNKLSDHLFMVPPDYNIISFGQFMDIVQGRQ